MRGVVTGVILVALAFVMMLVGLSMAAGIVIGAALLSPAKAQGGHAEHHDWYQHLRSNSGGSCCNALTPDGQGDCRPVRARPRADGRGWEAYFSGGWQSVPPNVVLPDELNQVPLYAHICEQSGFIHCFLKGGGGI